MGLAARALFLRLEAAFVGCLPMLEAVSGQCNRIAIDQPFQVPSVDGECRAEDVPRARSVADARHAAGLQHRIWWVPVCMMATTF